MEVIRCRGLLSAISVTGTGTRQQGDTFICLKSCFSALSSSRLQVSLVKQTGPGPPYYYHHLCTCALTRDQHPRSRSNMDNKSVFFFFFSHFNTIVTLPMMFDKFQCCFLYQTGLSCSSSRCYPDNCLGELEQRVPGGSELISSRRVLTSS